MKKFFTGAVIVLISFVQLIAAPVPDWLRSAVIYHIYPSSYCDSDGDGIGDLEGIRSKLDYIKSVGFNTIWMSPCFKSEFEDGGYDITDFYQVDPRFGTNQQLVDLIKDAHAKDMRVCLDLVAGHTSDKHPWFVQSCEPDTSSHYSDYFIWNNDSTELPSKKFVKAGAKRNGNYLCNFFEIQPALNYGYANPDPTQPWQQGVDAPGPRAVRQEIKNIMDFWMSKGVDGFRCDLAPSLIKGDDKNFTANKKLWQEFRQWIDDNHPGCIIISEWSQPANAIEAGFHIDLIIHNKWGNDMYRPLFCQTSDKGEPTPCFFDKNGQGAVDRFVKRYSQQITATAGKGYGSMPTCSHDIWRLNRLGRSTPAELKTAMTFFFTMPWIPIVYYGEEIGMRNIEDAPYKEGSKTARNRSGCRTPMQWDSTLNAGFSSAAAEDIYLPFDPDPSRPTVAAQLNDPKSLLNYVRGLVALRNEYPALGTEGSWTYLSSLEQPYPMIFMRQLGEERFIVAINPSGKTVSSTFDAPADKAVAIYGTELSNRYKVKGGKATIVMKPISATIFRLD